MAGHSHWAGIKHKKALVDKKRGKLFSKLARHIMSAAREGGGDLAINLKLKYAIEKAREANMPKDNIDRALKKGLGELPGEELQEVIYEGYGPGGVAILLEILTDNRNRTASEIRHAFERRGGNMGENGCVSWMFEKKGVLHVESQAVEEEALMDLAMDAGAEDMRLEGDYFVIVGAVNDFEAIRKAVADAGLPLRMAELSYVPKMTVPVGAGEGKKLLQLLEDLEDHEDVQNTFANFDLPDEVLREIEA